MVREKFIQHFTHLRKYTNGFVHKITILIYICYTRHLGTYRNKLSKSNLSQVRKPCVVIHN